MSHLHKNRNAMINDAVPDLPAESERTPQETAQALNAALQCVDVRDTTQEAPADPVQQALAENATEEVNLEELTKEELGRLLDDYGIEHSPRMTKAELIALVPPAE